jgi:hypothetical protein
VKDRRKGPIGRAAGLAEGVAATVRRLQREREPRLLVYDETGYARLVQPDARGYERLLETADRMVALVSQAEADAKPRLVRRAEKGEDADGPGEEGEPKKPRAERAGAKAKKPGAGRAADGKKPKKSRAARAERAGAKASRPKRAGGAKKPKS